MTLVKLFTFFIAIMYTQYVILENYNVKEKKLVQKNLNHTFVLLYYEVLMFYFNIISLIVFLVVSRFLSFRKL